MNRNTTKCNRREETNTRTSAYELSTHEVGTDGMEQTQTSVEQLEKQKRSKEDLEKKKEQNMTIMIGMILVSFLVCTIPGAVVIQMDPKAEKYTNVSNFLFPYSLSNSALLP